MLSEKILTAVNENGGAGSLQLLRSALYGNDLSVEISSQSIGYVLENSIMKQYVKKTFIAEILFWTNPDDVYVETPRLRYSKAVKIAIESAEISEYFARELKSLAQKVRRLRDLLDRSNFTPNLKDSTGNCALHYASLLGINKVALGLIVLGADINQVNRQNYDAVALAADRGRKELLKEMIDKALSLDKKYLWENELTAELIKNEWDVNFFNFLKYKKGGMELPEELCITVDTDEVLSKDRCKVTADGYWVKEYRDSMLCAVCGKYYWLITNRLCEGCADKKIKCPITGDLMLAREMTFNQNYELLHAPGISIRSKIQGYHVRPELNFFKLPTEINIKRFYGFELELVVPSIKEEVLSSMKIDGVAGSELYMNRDASIGVHIEDGESYQRGYELISHPMTLNYIKESKKIREAFGVLQDFKGRSLNNRTTGLHIHVSRNGIGGTNPSRTIERFHKFIYSEDSREFILEIAGRSDADTSYTSFRRATTDRPLHTEYTGGSRYQAINYTNYQTIEIRIFKGVVGHYPLLERIEFIDALLDFCGDVERDLSVDGFEEFVFNAYRVVGSGKGAKKVYKWEHLKEFLENRKSSRKNLPFLYAA